MSEEDYTASELAEAYQISVQQASRYIARFGPSRKELDALLACAPRTASHRLDEINRTAADVAFG